MFKIILWAIAFIINTYMTVNFIFFNPNAVWSAIYTLASFSSMYCLYDASIKCIAHQILKEVFRVK